MSAKIGLVILIGVALMAEGAHAADKIVLPCSGTMFAPGKFGPMKAPDEFFIVDLDRGIVTAGSLGDFNITKLTDDKIDFISVSGPLTAGGVNRLTGEATITSWSDTKEVVWGYNLHCKRSNPLF